MLFRERPEAIEVLLSVMGEFGECYSSNQKQQLLEILKMKLTEAVNGENFLVFVKNPIKVCLLLCEFLTRSLRVADFPFLKHEGGLLIGQLKKVAKEILTL